MANEQIKYKVIDIKTQNIIGYEMVIEEGWVFQEVNGGWLSGVFDLGKGYRRELCEEGKK